MKESIIAVDFEQKGEWKFVKELNRSTGLTWKTFGISSNKDRVGITRNLLRYFKYFYSGIKLFIERDKYENIISWQQFVGIIYAFFCRLFHVRKANSLIIMTFIFKAKNGFIGRVYYSFIKYAISSDFVDKIVCFSSTEPDYYAKKFNLNNDKFCYIPLSYELKVKRTNNDLDRNKIVSIGFSNRDIDFLTKVFDKFNYSIEIFCDRDLSIGSNIVMSSEKLEDKTEELMSKSRLLLIPLKDKNISAGQLTALQAMQFGVPIIGTLSNGLKDFVEDQKNGFLIPNEIDLWKNSIVKIMSDDDLWRFMSRESIRLYEKNHSTKAMAEGVANLLNNKYKEAQQ